MVTRINPCRDQDLDTLFCNDARPCARCRRYGVRKSWRRIGWDEELDTLFSRTHTGQSVFAAPDAGLCAGGKLGDNPCKPA